MLYFVLKVTVTVLVVVAVSEVAKRSTLLAALLASLPLVSLLAMSWLYVETRSAEKVAELATGILWMIVPSLALFVLLPLLLRRGVGFYLSMGISVGVTAGLYLVMLVLLRRFGAAA